MPHAGYIRRVGFNLVQSELPNFVEYMWSTQVETAKDNTLFGVIIGATILDIVKPCGSSRKCIRALRTLFFSTSVLRLPEEGHRTCRNDSAREMKKRKKASNDTARVVSPFFRRDPAILERLSFQSVLLIASRPATASSRKVAGGFLVLRHVWQHVLSFFFCYSTFWVRRQEPAARIPLS